jgi:hypothetical protein
MRSPKGASLMEQRQNLFLALVPAAVVAVVVMELIVLHSHHKLISHAERIAALGALCGLPAYAFFLWLLGREK